MAEFHATKRPQIRTSDMTQKNYSIIPLSPSRRYPHHAPVNLLDENNLIFVTVCTQDRICWLDNERAHQILRKLWSDKSHWIVGPYILMPDHIHQIVGPASSQDAPLSEWIGWWKRMSVRQFAGPKIAWQKSFWDTRLRNEEHVAEKIQYMAHNPVRKGLAKTTSEWRFQGAIYRLHV
jgi:REP element-mobilizing transposase RayT